MASQYMFMPLINKQGLICSRFDLRRHGGAESSCCAACPRGRHVCTFFTYVSRANVTLSLLMTTCAAPSWRWALMPLLIFVYVGAPPELDDDAPKMNYLAIVVTLIVATTPAVLGWRLRRAGGRGARPPPGDA